jgi:hypothetical protein
MCGRASDAVLDWIAYTPKHIETDLGLFRGRCGSYTFISSTSACQKSVSQWPITEDTARADRKQGCPVTTVRPSHTYDRTTVSRGGGYTVIDCVR